MCKEEFLLTVDEEAQSLIINSLLLMRNTKLEEGMDVDWIGDVIVDVCNAPRKKSRSKGDEHER